MCQTLGDSSYDSLAIKCVCMLQLKWTVSIERRTKAGHGGWQKTNKNRDPFLGCFKRPVKETKKAQSRDLKQARWVNQKIWARLMDKGERVNVKCTSIEKRFPTQLSTKSAFLLEVSFTHAQKPSYRPMPKHFLIFTCTLILEWLHRRQLWATQLYCIHGPRILYHVVHRSWGSIYWTSRFTIWATARNTYRLDTGN